MKYRVSYECRAGNEIFAGSFEVEQPTQPHKTDPALLEIAMRDSSKFHQSGLAGISIVDIKNAD